MLEETVAVAQIRRAIKLVVEFVDMVVDVPLSRQARIFDNVQLFYNFLSYLRWQPWRQLNRRTPKAVRTSAWR